MKSVRVRIILPGAVDHSNTVKQIVDRWGGCTIYRGEGRWFSDVKRGTVIDPVLIVDTSIGHWEASDILWWNRLAAEVAREHAQESVFLSVQPEEAALVSADGTITGV